MHYRGKLHVNHSLELWLKVKSVGMVSTLPGEKCL